MIKLDWTLILQFVNFMLLMAVLNVMLFNPLRAMLKKRRETIEGARSKVVDLEEQAQAQQARYEEQLQAARLEGNQQRAELRKVAQREEAKVLAEANQKAGAQLSSIKEQMASEVEVARQALREQTEALASEIAGKVLGRAV